MTIHVESGAHYQAPESVANIIVITRSPSTRSEEFFFQNETLLYHIMNLSFHLTHTKKYYLYEEIGER